MKTCNIIRHGVSRQVVVVERHGDFESVTVDHPIIDGIGCGSRMPRVMLAGNELTEWQTQVSFRTHLHIIFQKKSLPQFSMICNFIFVKTGKVYRKFPENIAPHSRRQWVGKQKNSMVN